jgi:hypothetical protein
MSTWGGFSVWTPQLDEDAGWRPLASGELVRVGADLGVIARVVLDSPPAKLLRLEDLDPRVAASQRPQGDA